MFVLLPNYILNLDESINLFGIGYLLKNVHNKYNKELREEFKKIVHPSTYYYWLSNKSPIKIKYLKIFINYDNIIEDVYKKVNYFSVNRKKVVLPKEFTSDLAYLIGVMHGDGHISKNLRNMDISEEELHFHILIKKLFKNIFHDNVSITKCKLEKQYKSFISSRVISSFFRLFCPTGKKKGKLKVPQIIKNNKHLLKEYLSGFFDTDGCLPHLEVKGKKSRNYFIFSQAHKDIVFEIYDCLKNLNLDINEPKEFKSPTEPYANNRDLIEWKISINDRPTLKKFFKIIKFRHLSKKKRADIIIKNLGS